MWWRLGEGVDGDSGLARALAVFGLDGVVAHDFLEVAVFGLKAVLVGVEGTLSLVAEGVDKDLRQQALVGARSAAAFGLLAPNPLVEICEDFVDGLHLFGSGAAVAVAHATRLVGRFGL